MYKLLSVVTFILFILIGMFNGADATSVYVIGSPEDLPEYDKKLKVKIRVVNRPSKGYVLVNLNTTSAMFGRCTNYPIWSQDATADLQLLKSDNTGDEWSDLGTGVLKYKLT